jgi:hypothetical protein
MTRQLFLYKCNSSGRAAQAGVGDWFEFFKQDQPSSWGGSETMDSSLSLKILREEMQVDDLVLCWQTNKKRGAVGICRVDELVDYDDDALEIWLELIGEPFDIPVRFTELKRSNLILANAHCLMPGGGTLFRTTRPEAVEILKACGIPKSLLQGGVSVSKSMPVVPAALKKGAGFGSPESNKLVEAAAVKVFIEAYGDWALTDRQKEKIGYDFEARKGRRVRHVEVKGAAGPLQQFPISVNEVACAKTDSLWRLFIVTSARTDAPIVTEVSGPDFLDDFERKVLSYMATRRKA